MVSLPGIVAQATLDNPTEDRHQRVATMRREVIPQPDGVQHRWRRGGYCGDSVLELFAWHEVSPHGTGLCWWIHRHSSSEAHGPIIPVSHIFRTSRR